MKVTQLMKYALFSRFKALQAKKGRREAEECLEHVKQDFTEANMLLDKYNVLVERQNKAKYELRNKLDARRAVVKEALPGDWHLREKNGIYVLDEDRYVSYQNKPENDDEFMSFIADLLERDDQDAVDAFTLLEQLFE